MLKFDTGFTYPHVDIILTPQLADQLNLSPQEQLADFLPVPAGKMYGCGEVKITSPVDEALVVPMRAGIICDQGGNPVPKSIALASLFAMGKLNCKIHAFEAGPEAAKLVRACDTGWQDI